MAEVKGMFVVKIAFKIFGWATKMYNNGIEDEAKNELWVRGLMTVRSHLKVKTTQQQLLLNSFGFGWFHDSETIKS